MHVIIHLSFGCCTEAWVLMIDEIICSLQSPEALLLIVSRTRMEFAQRAFSVTMMIDD